jgi:hypothetical protein
VSACKALSTYYIVVCGLSGATIVLHVVLYTAQFSENLLDIKYLFCLSLQLFSEKILIHQDILIKACYIPGSWRWDLLLLLVDGAQSDGSIRTLKE